MKKLCLFCIMAFSVAGLSANPVYAPAVYLDELIFDAGNQWKITLFVQQAPDSILVSSSSGRSCYSGHPDGDWILTADSLYEFLAIDPAGDSVAVISFFMSWEGMPDSLVEIIVFGNYPGSVIPRPLEGQSIVRIFSDIMGTDYHCLRSASGINTGTVYGRVVDKENNPVEGGSFCLSPFPVRILCADNSYQTDGFDIQEGGGYSASLYALCYSLDTIQVCAHEISVYGCPVYRVIGSLRIDPRVFAMYPDSSVEMEIHLLEDFSGVQEIKKESGNTLTVYPNPVVQGIFHYETGIPVRSTKCMFVLYDTGGQAIWIHPLTGSQGEMQLPSVISSGIYFLQLRMDDRPLASAPMVIKQ